MEEFVLIHRGDIKKFSDFQGFHTGFGDVVCRIVLVLVHPFFDFKSFDLHTDHPSAVVYKCG